MPADAAEPYVASRGDYGQGYASGLVELVEQWNCALGCIVPTEADKAEHGPGGCCELLARLFTGDPLPEFDPQPDRLVCTVRTPANSTEETR
jgi:hypothetical protein